MLRGFLLFFLFLNLSIIKAQVPSMSATSLTITQTYCSQTNLSWTNGDGTSRIVIASKDVPLSNLPQQNVYYLASDSFGNGGALSASEFIVYNGTGSSVTVKKLDPNTTYYFSVFEYNGSGTVFDYLTSNYPQKNRKTENLILDFTMSDDYQCELNNRTDFVALVTQTNPQTLTYNWNFGDMTTSSVSSPAKSYTNYGIYKVTLKVSSPGCFAVVSKYDTIAPAPIVDFELDPAYSNNTVVQCFYKPDGSPNAFYFKNNSSYRYLSTPSSNTVFKWVYGDGTFDNQIVNGDVSYAKPGTYSVKLIVSNSFTPRDEVCSDSFEMVLEVREKPIDTTLLQLDSVQCINNNVFNFDHKTKDITASHIWDFGDGNTATTSTVSHTYNSVGNYELILEVTDANGCYDIYKDSVAVVEQPINSFSGLNSSYCINDDDVMLIPLIPDGIWIGNQVNSAGVFSPSQLGSHEISYAVDEDGCKDTFSSSTVVFDIPIFNLGSDTSICQGDEYVKKISKAGASILWSTGDVDSFTTVDKAGLLWAQKSKNGCTYRDTLQVRVIRAPYFELGNDSLLCGDGVKNIDVTTSEAIYSWNDGYVGGVRSINSSGSYSVTVTNKCGVYTDDIDLTFLPFACEIFIPNVFSPNDDGLNDVFKPSGNVTIKSMQIFNRWGELLYKSVDKFAWDGKYEGSFAQSGYYFFIIQYEKPENGIDMPYVSSGEVYLVR